MVQGGKSMIKNDSLWVFCKPALLPSAGRGAGWSGLGEGRRRKHGPSSLRSCLCGRARPCPLPPALSGPRIGTLNRISELTALHV